MQKELKIAMITAFLMISLATISSASAAQVYNITDSSYSNYFNTSGYINNTGVRSGDVFDISGNVNNKDMYIDRPLNITSTGRTANIFNGTITILSGGSGTNITNLVFNNTNHNGNVPGTVVLSGAENCTVRGNTIITNQDNDNSYGIHLVEANNNHIKNNTITTTGHGTSPSTGLTYGVYLQDSSFNLFDSNTVHTTGASADVDWSAYPDPGIYTTIGVFLKEDSSSNNFINNTITTDYNEVASSWGYDSLMGVRIMGGTDNQLTGNRISTTGNSYAYGAEIVGTSTSTAKDNVVSGNIINTTGNTSAQGVKVGGYSENTVVSQNIVKSVADSYSYGIYLEENYGSTITIKNATITRNKATAIGDINYVIELYSVSGSTITDNVLVGIGNYSMGIGAYKSSNNTIKYNTITTIGDDSAPHIYNGDAISEGNEGIKLISGSSQNIIQFNIITSSAKYAINSTASSNNTITNNYLISDNQNKQGNNAITSGTGDAVRGNYGKKPTADFSVNANEGTGSLTVQFTGTSQGDITDWAWDFDGDGVVDCEAQYSTYTYNKPGTYTAKLTVTGPGGTDSKIIYITINPDNTAPLPKTNIKGGSYKTGQKVTLTATDNTDSNPKIYYTLNGTTPTTKSALYKGPISISKTTKLKFIAIDSAGNPSSVQTETYTIDKVAPKASSNIKSKTYKNNQKITLRINEPGTIYYTTNGSTPTVKSKKYTAPINITKTTTLKYIAIDKAGNKSPVYKQKYTIDKTAPKITKTTVHNAAIVSLTAPITIKFSENIVKGINYTKIYLKNLSTGKLVAITKTIKGNTLTIKQTRSRLHNNTYQLYIPVAALKDKIGNKITKYTFKFRTR